ncbi:MAG TPA: c-type cytochrome biogenesis protein CcmI [Pseudolabrys sp.]|nr:c-type cytochrome biogenesis protein CcmI [Pseudolabrys sp.]
MTLWFVFALMTAAAIFAVLWPLSRATATRTGDDLAVYRDQLDEIKRDRAGGMIGEAEAEAARVEVSRRLIAAADAADAVKSAPQSSPLRRRRLTAIAGLVLLPVCATAIYMMLGSPQLPGAPLAPRLRAAAHANESITALVSQVEARLERNPQDGRGWEVLAPVYLRLGRFDDAAKAWRKAIALEGETADRQANLGEALVGANNGIVTADAKAAFDRALALDSYQIKSRFFAGVAAQQDGNKDKAEEIWRGMLKDAPAAAPWKTTVEHALASLSEPASAPSVAAANGNAAAPGPSAQDVAAASRMTADERGKMIRGMVARLADKLKQDGSDVDGWLRLVRAYMVLGERDKANAAAADARRALASDPDKLHRIDELAKGLGLAG